MSVDTGVEMGVGERTGTVQPFPPRYWWLKRIAMGVGLLFVALFGLRIWWGAVAHRRLQTEIERIRAAGEPIWPENFDPDPVRDEDNAAIVLINAATLLTQPVGSSLDARAILANPDIVAERLEEVRSFIELNAPALELAREARGKPGVDWGIRFRSLAFYTLLPSLSGQRALGKLLCAAAIYHHQINDDGAAIENLRDALALGAAVDRESTLVSHMVATAIDRLVFSVIQGLAPDLDVEGAEGDLGGRPATRDQIASLVNDLIDEDGYREGIVRADHCERMIMLDAALMCARGQATVWMIKAGAAGGQPPLATRALTWPVRPLFELDAVWMMRCQTQWAKAAAEPDYPRFLAKCPDEETLFENPGTLLTRPLSRTLRPSVSRAHLLHFAALARRRMAATALAIRLYQAGHGHRPQRLSDLVPEYLASVPLDPFAADSRTLAYEPDADPPILYSVGSNGVDDGGGTLTRTGRLSTIDGADIVFFLDGNPPRNE